MFSQLNIFVKSLTIFLLLILLRQEGYAQLDTVFITCEKSVFDSMYSNFSSDELVDIQITYKNNRGRAQMRVRGDSSREFDKKSLKIRFPFSDGSSSMNLNAEFLDKSYMHQYMASKIYQLSGQPTFDTKHVVVYLNNDMLGIYLHVGGVNSKFLAEHGLDANNNLYKAKRDYSNLSLFDNAYTRWDKKTNVNGDRSDLVELIQNINLTPDSAFLPYVKQNFDYSNIINAVALNMLLANGSTYYHNYFLYHDKSGSGKWMYMAWDMDKSMGSYNAKFPYFYSSWSWKKSGAMPENPLVKRLLLNRTSFKDVQVRIKELTASVFNEATLYPKIDSVKQVLLPYIESDNSDKIKSIEEWEKAINIMKQYIIDRPVKLKNQMRDWPSLFKLYNSYNQQFKDEIKLEWQASTIKNGKAIVYNIKIGAKAGLEKEYTTEYKNVSDTFLVIKDLEPGRYFWHVIATEGNVIINGFNTRNFFEVGKAEFLSGEINETITIKNKTVVVSDDLVITKNGTLKITGKSTILIAAGKSIRNNGTLIIEGSEANRITITSADERSGWKGIHSEGVLDVSYADFSQAEAWSVIRQVHGEAKMVNCTSKYNTCGSAISFNDCPVVVTNNVFSNSKGEGILFLKCSGIINHNIVIGLNDGIEGTFCHDLIIENNYSAFGSDDGLDVNYGVNIKLQNNTAYGNKDKGLSITADTNCTTNVYANNYVANNSKGIGGESVGVISLENNVYVNNKESIVLEKFDHLKISSTNELFVGTRKMPESVIATNNTVGSYSILDRVLFEVDRDLDKNISSITISSTAPFPINLDGLFIKSGNDVLFNAKGILILFPNKEIELIAKREDDERKKNIIVLNKLDEIGKITFLLNGETVDEGGLGEIKKKAVISLLQALGGAIALLLLLVLLFKIRGK